MGIRHEESKLAKAPVWIKLPCLNIQLWTKKGLSKIASALGKPMSTDGLTDKKGMLNYARILVEIELNAPVKQFLKCKLPDGTFYKQQILYEWMPTQCGNCNLWGHKEENCPKDKPQTAVTMEPNIEPLQRGLLPTACLKISEVRDEGTSKVSPPGNGTEMHGTGGGHFDEGSTLRPVASEPVEVLTKRQKKKKKKNNAASISSVEIGQEGQSSDNPKMSTRSSEIQIQRQNQQEVEVAKPPDPGGKQLC